MKAIYTIFSLLIFGFGYCQKAEMKYVHKNLVLSTHGGFGIMDGEGIGTGGYSLFYRLDDLQHAFGVSFLRDINMTDVARYRPLSEMPGEQNTYLTDENIQFTSIMYTYRYYLKNPSKQKLNFHIGVSVGPSLQIHIVAPDFLANAPTIDIDDFFTTGEATIQNLAPIDEYQNIGLGAVAKANFGLEYATNYALLFVNTNLGYTHINSKIDFFERNSTLSAYLRLGIAIDLFKKK